MQIIEPIRTQASCHTETTGKPKTLARQHEVQKTEMMLRAALEKAGRSELKRIRVDVDGDTVHLRGCVTSYFLKQVAQEAVRPLAIGLRIDNRVRVNLN